MLKRIRLWHPVNGADVLLTVRPGVPVCWQEWHPTDEGFVSVEYRISYFCDTFLEYNAYRRARDCDGLTESHECWTADVQGMTDNRPKWRRQNRRMFDHSAMAANY